MNETSGRSVVPSDDVAPFLTVFDPTDLPGTSVDPMGFDRATTFLSDRLLPGLTNVASIPRYLSMLCAAASLDGTAAILSPREEASRRTETVLAFERFWALANVLVSRTPGKEAFSAQGIRGISFAEEHLRDLERKKADRTDGKFTMLMRQGPYGAIGIYGRVAERLRLVQRDLLRPTPEWGAQLAEGFLEGTDAPRVLRRAVLSGGEVSLGELRRWGERAHIRTLPKGVEAQFLGEAFNRDPTRQRVGALLMQVPRKDEEPELKRLERIARAGTKASPDICIRSADPVLTTRAAAATSWVNVPPATPDGRHWQRAAAEYSLARESSSSRRVPARGRA